VDEEIVGIKGRMLMDKAVIKDHKGKVLYQFDKKKENQPYQAEHDELFAAVAKGEHKFWDAERAAKTTLTAIIGRLATYSGQTIAFDKALNSGLNLQPATYAVDAAPPVVPDASGNYAYAKPGITRYFS
jgi:hypothetical protein